jgi:hypothetical protein
MSLKEELAEWQECQTKRKALEREAKTLRDREAQLEDKFEAELKKSEKQSIVRSGFTLAWVAGRATVQWAAEYLKECGAEKANALKQSAANDAPKKLSITPPA